MVAGIQKLIYGGPEQSEKERAKCSFTVDARMLLIAFLTFMTYVMYHAPGLLLRNLAEASKMKKQPNCLVDIPDILVF